MEDIFAVMEQEQEIDVSGFMQKVYFFSNELEKTRKKFLKKISKFNIRNTFDKLQNNVQNQKTMNLINTLQKKILNEDSNLNRGLTNSSIKANKKTVLSSFNTINIPQRKDFGSTFNKKTNELINLPSIKEENSQENSAMTNFFKKIKNNLETKNTKKSEKNIINEENSSSSSSEEEDDKPNQKESSKDLIEKNKSGNKFAENFEKQRTFFENKMIKFGKKDGKDNNYLNDDILEQEDEEDNELYIRRSSQDLEKDNPFYERTKNSILNNINLENNLNKDKKLFETAIIPSSKISNSKKEEESPYDKSDYDSLIQCGSIEESNIKNEEEKKAQKNKKSIKRIKSDEITSISGKFKLNAKSGDNTPHNTNDDLSKNNFSRDLSNNYSKAIKTLKKQSNNLNQLLFCSRVAIENSLEVCQTISSCYKWIEENYLVAQIKKVIKEAKLKQKQKEDKEKYGNMGNMPNKDKTKKQQNIIRTSDQSFKLLLNMIMGIQIAVQSIPNFHIKAQENLNKYLTNMLYSIQTINFDKKKKKKFLY